MTETLQFLLGMVENKVEKGENAGIFFFCSNVSISPLSLVIKSPDCLVEL